MERKWNVFWFEAAFVSYTYVYLVFVAGVLLGLAGFLPVSEKKSLQGKAGTQFVASYLLAGALQSSAELASIKTMRS